MKRRNTVVALLLLALCGSCATVGLGDSAETPAFDDPIFDFDQIMNEPLDAKVLKSTEADGIVTEEVEYTAEIRNGAPVRIFGVLAYPKGGEKLPIAFWSQGGMYPAGTWAPHLYAKKGYMGMTVTLPHDVYNSFARFATEDAKSGNLTGLAVVQMRAITYMAQRPETDASRIGIGGTSYGGFFASLIAAADPRIDAGVSFFTTGNHDLGTNYPQFTQLRTSDEIGIWLGTIDPAWRFKRRAVPFIWGVAANDH